MNLPSGTIIEENIPLKTEILMQKIKTVMEEHFSGYIIITCSGITGIEEAIFLIRKGELSAIIVNYDAIEKELIGEQALPHALNLLKAQHGIYDIIALTTQQIDLIIAFNEEIKLKKKYDFRAIQKMLPLKYSEEFSKKLIEKETTKTKEELFKELGLTKVIH